LGDTNNFIDLPKLILTAAVYDWAHHTVVIQHRMSASSLTRSASLSISARRRLSSMYLHPRYAGMAQSVLLSVVMSFVASGVSTTTNFGFHDGYMAHWMTSWFASWMVSTPSLLVALPAVKFIVSLITDSEEDVRAEQTIGAGIQASAT
jgi:hypothetical protein